MRNHPTVRVCMPLLAATTPAVRDLAPSTALRVLCRTARRLQRPPITPVPLRTRV